MTSTPRSAPIPVAVVPSYGDLGRLDFSRCLADAGAVYWRNVGGLIGAALLTDLLSVVSLGVLAGPLYGGWCLMTLSALSRPDRKIDHGLLLSGSYRFWDFTAVFILSGVAQIAGLAAFVLPGLLVLTLWLFPFHLIVDRGLGPMDALAASTRIVRRRGLGPNFMLAVLVFLMVNLPSFHPFLWPIKWVLSPFGWLLVSAAYIQEVREVPGEAAEVMGHGFPIQPTPPAGGSDSQTFAADESLQPGTGRA